MAALGSEAGDGSASDLVRWIPEALRGLIEGRELVLGRAVSGQRLGPHRSRRAGPGRDFLEHRAYMPGDDLRRLDWRAVGRRDRLVVRRTESEDEFGLALVLDAGGGMRFPTKGPGPTKLDAALALAATLAHLARRRRDPIGFVVGGAGELDAGQLNPSARTERASAMARRFAALEADTHPNAGRERRSPTGSGKGKGKGKGSTPDAGRCAWEPLLGAVASHVRRPSLVAIFSDLLDPAFTGESDPAAATRATLAAMASLRARGHMVVFCNLLHRDELEFRYNDDQVRRFIDLHGHRPAIEGAGASLRDSYLRRLNAHLEQLRAQCETRGVIYLRAVVGDALGKDLSPALTELLDRIALRQGPAGQAGQAVGLAAASGESE